MNVPTELRVLPQWVCWRREQRGGKPTKVPVDPHSGALASSTDPATWSSFDDAVAAVARYGCNGVGYVFSKTDPYAGLDLDHCRNPRSGVIAPAAQAIISRFTTYGEVSVSGTGVHLIMRATLPPSCRHRARLDGFEVEIYDRKRYFVVTGNRLACASAEIRGCQPQIGRLVEDLFGRRSALPTSATLSSQPELDDEALIDRAQKAANGSKFARLWRGETADYGGDESRADLALLSLLAFWCGGDPLRIDRLFRRSGLYRQKWEREDYRTASIALACGRRTASDGCG
jgi:primase-polymerase (primpol)-like protein